ncbi:MAG: hypothetical protein IKA76_02285 [Clostridia bacterium]|nr:hypothetical protein [Clostridia bacterium]
MSDENMNRETEPNFDTDRETEEISAPKRQKHVSLTTFVCSAIALVVATAITVGAGCFFGYRKKLSEIVAVPGQLQSTPADAYYPYELIGAFFDRYSLKEVDHELMTESALKAYVYATGDRYAAYYTEEESKTLFASNAGSSEGIGINIIEDEATVGGVAYKVLRVVNVMEGSPALAAGMRLGDMICAVGIGENAETISTLGYDIALKKLQGSSGTEATFTVFRPTDDGMETKEFRIMRAKVTTTSVRGQAVTWQGKKVGVVKIFQFDATTPAQFKSEMNRLIEEGCGSFVYDVRSNPGGALTSIEAVLSYFLNKNDVLIITRDNQGNEEISRVAPVTYSGTYAACSVKESEIGMYRKYPSVVLCNENTASAGELFTAAFRDYGLAPVVGTTTYGKGTMQRFFDLGLYGYKGTLRLTVAAYYPPSDKGYDGVGITPDHVVEPSEELKKLNLFEVNLAKDNQLTQALNLLDGNS